MPQPFVIKKGDRAPSLEASFGVSLAGGTVAFTMAPKAPGSAPKVNAAAAVVVDAAKGWVRYDWGATDTDTVGVYLAEFVATLAGGIKRSEPSSTYLEIHVIAHVPRPA